MNGYCLYRYFLSLKLHFNQDNYDVFQTRGGVNASYAAFERRRDKSMFERLAKKFKDDREAIRFLVSNYAYGNDSMIWGNWENAQDNLIHWTKNKESLSKVFEDDLYFLLNQIDNGVIDKTCAINCTENKVSSIINYLKAGKVNIETVCLLCELNPGLIESWRSIPTLETVYGNDFRRINKLRPFVKCNDNIRKIWEEVSPDLK